MADSQKYTFTLGLDLASMPRTSICLIVSMDSAKQAPGTCVLNNFQSTPALTVHRLNIRAHGDVTNGITLGPGAPAQVIFSSFQAGATGVTFDLTVTPGTNSGAINISLGTTDGITLPTSDSTSPVDFGWITWDASGNFSSSGTISGSGAKGIQDQGFTGTMTAAA